MLHHQHGKAGAVHTLRQIRISAPDIGIADKLLGVSRDLFSQCVIFCQRCLRRHLSVGIEGIVNTIDLQIGIHCHGSAFGRIEIVGDAIDHLKACLHGTVGRTEIIFVFIVFCQTTGLRTICQEEVCIASYLQKNTGCPLSFICQIITVHPGLFCHHTGSRIKVIPDVIQLLPAGHRLIGRIQKVGLSILIGKKSRTSGLTGLHAIASHIFRTDPGTFGHGPVRGEITLVHPGILLHDTGFIKVILRSINGLPAFGTGSRTGIQIIFVLSHGDPAVLPLPVLVDIVGISDKAVLRQLSISIQIIFLTVNAPPACQHPSGFRTEIIIIDPIMDPAGEHFSASRIKIVTETAGGLTDTGKLLQNAVTSKIPDFTVDPLPAGHFFIIDLAEIIFFSIDLFPANGIRTVFVQIL